MVIYEVFCHYCSTHVIITVCIDWWTNTLVQGDKIKKSWHDLHKVIGCFWQWQKMNDIYDFQKANLIFIDESKSGSCQHTIILIFLLYFILCLNGANIACPFKWEFPWPILMKCKIYFYETGKKWNYAKNCCSKIMTSYFPDCIWSSLESQLHLLVFCLSENPISFISGNSEVLI